MNSEIKLTKGMAESILEAESICNIEGQAGIDLDLLLLIKDIYTDLAEEYSYIYDYLPQLNINQ